MAVGLGIHGEPGIDETGIPTADGLAELLVSRLLDELPAGIDTTQGARVVPILNGLGSLKYEEMFVVYRRIAQLLTEAGTIIVDPHVGEYCTSFDMAGTSLTLFWLDDELAPLWDAPVDTPAYRRGSVAPIAHDAGAMTEAATATAAVIQPASDASRGAAGVAAQAVAATAEIIDLHVNELGRLDQIAGDGDHGIGMQRGARSAREAATSAAKQGAGAGTVLIQAGNAWSDRAGGTSGALWGVILRAVGETIGDEEAPSASSVSAGVAAAAAGVMAYGKAEVGDKTMVDALVPFSTELTRAVDAGARLADAWATAADAATSAAASTADLLPRTGRARAHGQNSVSTPDPGAHSLALIATAIGAMLADVADERN